MPKKRYRPEQIVVILRQIEIAAWQPRGAQRYIPTLKPGEDMFIGVEL